MHVRTCPVTPEGCIEKLDRVVHSFQPDVLVTLGDIPWVYYLAEKSVREKLDANRVRWILYYPIDGTLPGGLLPKPWICVLDQTDQAIAMSSFGVESSARSGIAAAYVPHGCDLHLFRLPMNKEAAKQRLKLNGKFVILSDARNHRRKLIPRLLDIVKAFVSNKSDVVLLLNTNIAADPEQGAYLYHLETDIKILELSEFVRLANTHASQPLSMDEVAGLYEASDVHLLCSWGEGFGLPTLQAAAAGIPTVAGGFSATKELVEHCGVVLNEADTAIDEFGIVRHFIARDSAVRALDLLYTDKMRRNELGQQAARWAGNLSWDAVTTRIESSIETCKLRTDRGAEGKWCLSEVLRPTGHDATLLPAPKITVPVRRAVISPPRNNNQLPSPVVITARSCSRDLAPLVCLFPGLRLEECPSDYCIGFLLESNTVVLVADPELELERGADLLCALARVSYIGPSPYWAKVSEDAVLLQARLLLTDYPLAASRWNRAQELSSFQRRTYFGFS